VTSRFLTGISLRVTVASIEPVSPGIHCAGDGVAVGFFVNSLLASRHQDGSARSWYLVPHSVLRPCLPFAAAQLSDRYRPLAGSMSIAGRQLGSRTATTTQRARLSGLRFLC